MNTTLSRFYPFSGTLLFGLFLSLAFVVPISAEEKPDDDIYRWLEHDFVFCFISDDGMMCNLGWADKAREMDFRYTLAVNPDFLGHTEYLTHSDMNQLILDGFEISNHSASHATLGMTQCSPDTLIPFCDENYWSLLGYFNYTGSFQDSTWSMPYFRNEIRRQKLSDLYAGLEFSDVKTFVYPSHGHSVEIVHTLFDWGYLGARNGSGALGESDFSTLPSNSWNGGISFFRVPLGMHPHHVFGNHSADPPVHFTHAQFVEAAMPIIEQFRATGGIMTMMAHHYGDDDTCHSTYWGYGLGGMTDTELGWLVDLVRSNNGIVMTFAEALEYYRDRAIMIERDNDLIWVALPAADVQENQPSPLVSLDPFPNPFNPNITINCRLEEEATATLAIYDLRGKKIKTLHQGLMHKGTHQITWNGRDEKGSNVPSGTYLGVLQLEQDKIMCKIALIR
jgi:FlgD Ig-like domain